MEVSHVVSEDVPETPSIQGRILRHAPLAFDEDKLAILRAQRAANVWNRATCPSRAVVRDQQIAVVGFGPSLLETWQAVRLFKTVISTSKAHDFLMARGIKPTFHLDVDYREHKAGVLTQPNDFTQYYLATHVHPTYAAKLPAAAMLHVTVPGGGPYESGFTKVQAQYDVGLQAAALAYMWGYRDQHWFGIDGSIADDDSTHAGSHPGVLKDAKRLDVIVMGRKFKSNALLAHQALCAEELLRAHGKMKVQVHGDGMMGPFLLERGVLPR